MLELDEDKVKGVAKNTTKFPSFSFKLPVEGKGLSEQ